MQIPKPPILLLILCTGWVTSMSLATDNEEADGNHRDGKFFTSFVPFNLFGNKECFVNQEEGRCYGEVECLALAGNYGPFCDGLRGLCCLFHRYCGDRTAQEVAYFRNRQWPLEHQDPNDCGFRVIKRDETYCGLNVVAQHPDQTKASEHCRNTNLWIEGAGRRKAMPLCVNNRASAIDYTLDMSKVDEVKLNVNSSTRSSASWNLKVTQIKCSDFSGEDDQTDSHLGQGQEVPPLIDHVGGGGSKDTTTSTTTTTTTTTPRPQVDNWASCGRGLKRNRQNEQSGYHGINRPNQLTKRQTQASISIARDNPFLDSLEFQGPDVSDSVFAYWKGPDSLLDNRVTYGTDAPKGHYRWQVAMFTGRKYHCGASIIGDRFILTAAHCVVSYKVNPSVLRLSIGDYDVSNRNDGDYIEAKIQEVRMHPSYSRSTLQNDIAVLKLTKSLQYSERVGPVCLPTSDIKTDNKRATVTGWGRDEHKKLKVILQELTSTAVTKGFCSEKWKAKGAPSGFIVDTMLCMDASQGDSCNGDSGGPLVMETPENSGVYVQVGLVSFGSGSCTDANLPGVYTRISKYRDWIRQQMY